MSQSKHSRRKFVKGGMIAAGATLPIAALCDAIYNSFLRNAYAEASGATTAPRNYINVAALGAPCRYAFDQWVRVNDNDPAIVSNPMVATRLTGSSNQYTDTAYEDFKVNNSAGGVRVPSFFKGSVTTTAGTQPLTDLLSNMLVIRGYGTNIDGHPGNHQSQLMPINGTPSISGAVADSSNLIFPAVQYPPRSGYTNFSSAMAKGLATIGDPALQQLMMAFGPTQTTRVADVRAAHANTINYYESRLRALASSSDTAAQSLVLNAENARKLMKRGVSDIQAYWGPAVARYAQIVTNNLRANGIYGINDQPVINTQGTSAFGTPRDNLFHFQTPSADNFRVVAPGYDYRRSLDQAVIYNFAEGLALAEYLITQKLGGVLELSLSGLGVVKPKVFTDSTQSAQQDLNGTVEHDMHTTGGVSMVMFTNALFRAFSAGVLELAAKLKATSTASGGNVWQDTVVHLTGDFGRIPRADGTGSDHGFNQMVSSVYSGMITETMVVGNVSNDTLYGDGYAGTQGVGAPIAGYSQAGRPTPVMAASTIAEMLRLPSNPYHNLAEPLIKVVDGKVTYNSSYGQGKTV